MMHTIFYNVNYVLTQKLNWLQDPAIQQYSKSLQGDHHGAVVVQRVLEVP